MTPVEAKERNAVPRAGPAEVWPRYAGGGLIVVVLLAYANTFSVPFVFDDRVSILENGSIRHWSTALFPPAGSTASGRPVLNLTLAANFALSGEQVWSYHAFNLLIHLAAGLCLFGIIRRTLAPRAGSKAAPFALATALLWSLHPLQTESVTYVIQRAESLMGLFYLLTLYCFIRGAEPGATRGRRWMALSLLACLCGMGTKEVMVSAPLVVLLYDRTFLTGTFAQAWRQRRMYYAGLAATWLVLAGLVLSTQGRNGTAGFDSGVAWWSYALAQFPVIIHYLRLSLWPVPLVFDYGTALAPVSPATLLAALAVMALLAATAWALVRKPVLGFLGAVFFLILAPTSSILPIATEIVAEHRMYLPLLPVLVILVAGIHRWTGRLAQPLCLILAGLCGAVTWARNEVYASALSLWRDTVERCPENPRAHNSLGCEFLLVPGRLDEALAQFELAVKLDPTVADYHNNLGGALEKRPGHLPEAIARYAEAVRLDPGYATARVNLGRSLLKFPGRLAEAVAQLEAAVRLQPDDAAAHCYLGVALDKMEQRRPEALPQVEEALRLKPDYAEAHNAMGRMLSGREGRLPEAMAHYEEALRLEPALADAHDNLGNALALLPGRAQDARHHYEEAVRLNPLFSVAHYNLARLEMAEGRTLEAVARYEEAVRADPDNFEAHNNLALVLEQLPGRAPEAIAHYQEALRVNPASPVIHLNLAVALIRTPGRAMEAVPQLERVLELQPGNEHARKILAWLQSTEGKVNP